MSIVLSCQCGKESCANANLAGRHLRCGRCNRITVYITREGTKSHAFGCQRPRGDAAPVGLLQADEKHEPCGDCWPPLVVSRTDSAPMALASTGESAAPTNGGASAVRATSPRVNSSDETPRPSVSPYPATTPTGIPLMWDRAAASSMIRRVGKRSTSGNGTKYLGLRPSFQGSSTMPRRQRPPGQKIGRDRRVASNRGKEGDNE
jgi:hypothetical protein